jgi:MFS transporter, ACS family, tartrate transporter
MTALQEQSLEDRARRRIAKRILPFLLLLYIIAFLDRVNVAYAALVMSHDLGFSDRVFGFGAGIFFIGYVLLEIPGALIVERWSARKWIARIMISWGLMTGLVGLVHTAHQFYAARFLLGAAEAGFFPGVIVYLTHWFRQQDRGKAIAAFLIGIPISSIIGSPLAGVILRLHWHGLPGWRWLFILEGIPAVLFGIVTIFYLVDWPQQARWLPPAEQEWITAELSREKQAKSRTRSLTIWQAMRQPQIVQLAVIYFLGDVGLYGFTMWFPTILKRASGLAVITVTLLGALPYIATLVADLLAGWHSDRAQERRWHTALPLFAGCLTLAVGFALAIPLAVKFMLAVLLAAFVHCWQPSFWALPSTMLGESAAAASIGLINSVGNLGGFAGPFLIGYLSTQFHSFAPGLGFLLVCLFVAGLLVLRLKINPLTPARNTNQTAQFSPPF